MQIVIDIPEDDYYDILQYVELKANTEFENLMISAIKDGTPLPKWHGRLIDADAIHGDSSWGLADRLEETPTIIEAESEEEE
jgi:hypothetical protein